MVDWNRGQSLLSYQQCDKDSVFGVDSSCLSQVVTCNVERVASEPLSWLVFIA